MASVTYDKASRLFPKADRPAVDALDLHVDDGEFLVLVGPSGCGKSTSLRMLAGLEEVTSGSVHIGGEDVTGVQARDRDVAMVFQSYALYPTMTVEENMGFALRNMGTSKKDTKALVLEAARILQLEEYLGRKPGQLSGGQRQRVAMGRAIVRRPQVFCMDEPLSNLDAKLRVATRTQIATLQRDLGTTTIYVTHDQVEAMTMGDRVAVLDKGRLQQVDTPKKLYNDPANAFVAGFIGSPAMNLFPVPVRDGRVDVPGVQATAPSGAGAEVTVGVRPEHLSPTSDGAGLNAVVELVEELGADSYVHTRTAEGTPIVFRGVTDDPWSKGDRVTLAAREDSVRFFDRESGARLR